MAFISPPLTLAPAAAIDLHLHTLYSDGTWTPEALLDYLAGEGFGLAAIADHDRLEKVTALQQLAAERQLPLLRGVEMTTVWQGEMTDLLCYGFGPEENALSVLALDVARRQCENTRSAVEKLQHQGYTFPQPAAALAALLEKPSSRQPHALAALLRQQGYGTADRPAGQIAMEAGVDFATTDLPAVVDAAHRSGAVCLVAHPGRGDGFMGFDALLLDQLRAEVPVDGLEVYHPRHSPEQVALYRDYARQHGWLVSSGSDSHGPEKPPIKYRAELSRALLERMGVAVS